MNKSMANCFCGLSKASKNIFDIIPKCFIVLLGRQVKYCESVFGFGVRYLVYRRLCKKWGEKVIIFPAANIFEPQNLTVGTGVSIHQLCYIDATGGIDIGDNVMISHGVTILSSTHNTIETNIPMKLQGTSNSSVTVCNDVWIGAKATILLGVNVGCGAIVAAGAVVNHDVEPYSVVGGVPARVIKSRIGE
jgi:acetyltransferase-like isoleucine patch superfamily enzyme